LTALECQFNILAEVDRMSTEIGTLLVSSPDVCGGRLRIDGTRITINQIATLYKQGFGAEEIADQYPHLTLAQVYAALSHYHANQGEIEADLEAEKQEAARLEREYQSSFNSSDADKSIRR
jgi:uncharacterized protein (DUF433 family)